MVRFIVALLTIGLLIAFTMPAPMAQTKEKKKVEQQEFMKLKLNEAFISREGDKSGKGKSK